MGGGRKLKRPPVGEVVKRTGRGGGGVRSGQDYEKGGRGGSAHDLHSLARARGRGQGPRSPVTSRRRPAYRGGMSMSRPVTGRRARRGRGRRAALAVVVAGTLVGAGAGVVAGGPAGAASGGRATTTEYYVALGDSLAAGVGADAGRGYVDDVYGQEKKKLHGLVLENLSCSGATTTSMIDGPGCSYTTGTQLGDAEAFLEAHPGQVAFVTIDIGANDVVGCTDTSTLTIDQDCVNQGMETIGDNLPVILSGLEAAGGSTPIV